MKTDYKNSIDYLFGLQQSGIKLGLENIGKLLKNLGECHNKFKSVHIAGTNGKGSTAAFLGSILKASGCKTGIYTSPHLVDFEERITIDGNYIPKSEVVRLINKIKKIAAKDVTYFEFATAIAFLWFAEQEVDIAIIETGLGGRYDATNLITPLVSIITNVSYDHHEFLGDELASIAWEKCGIIKKSHPVITGAMSKDNKENREVMKVIKKESTLLKSDLYSFGLDFNVKKLNAQQGWRYTSKSKTIDSFKIPLPGEHQAFNVGPALKCVSLLEEKLECFNWDESKIINGIANVRWPGRMEIISESPKIILDGAHNEAAGGILAEYLKENCKNVIFVIGIMKDKNILSFLKQISNIASLIVIAEPEYHRAIKIDDLSILIENNFPEIKIVKGGSVADAVKKAIKLGDASNTICVTGSLFTVGEARVLFTD